MLPFCCQLLNKFVCNPHKYWILMIVWCPFAPSFDTFFVISFVKTGKALSIGYRDNPAATDYLFLFFFRTIFPRPSFFSVHFLNLFFFFFTDLWCLVFGLVKPFLRFLLGFSSLFSIKKTLFQDFSWDKVFGGSFGFIFLLLGWKRMKIE